MYYPRIPNMRLEFNPQAHSRPPFQRNLSFRPLEMGIPRHRLHFRNDINFHKTEHWCETCDRGFPSGNLLEQHKEQHQKCNIDGCQFIAHPKVITKHIQMQHSTGLFKKIAKLNNPEEIRKWREERKKKYPTKENVERKEAEIKEKIERGEKMGLKQAKNKYDNGKKLGEPLKRKYPSECANSGNRRKITNESNNKRKRPLQKEKDLPIVDDKRKLKPFAGIQNLFTDSDKEIQDEPEQNNFIIEDEDCLIELQDKTTTNLNTVKPVVCGALSSLMCEYGSSDEDTEKDKIPEVIDANEKKHQESENKDKITSTVKNGNNKHSVDCFNEKSTNQLMNNLINDDEDSGPEEVKVEKQMDALTNETVEESYKKDKSKILKCRSNIQSKKPVHRVTKPKVPSTLIYKLLHREIQQERNIILQCVRHIVKNNYFDK